MGMVDYSYYCGVSNIKMKVIIDTDNSTEQRILLFVLVEIGGIRIAGMLCLRE